MANNVKFYFDEHICWTGAQDDFGGMIRVLIEFAEQHTSEDTAGDVFWLK